jgi:hypothetical protein
MSEEVTHHQYGPSALKHFEICPQYKKEESDTVHPVTLEGTMLHERVETGDLSGLDSRQEGMVRQCLEFLSEHSEGADEVLPEQKYSICEGLTFGTVDATALWPEEKRALVADWKFGFNGVDCAQDNVQGCAYCIGVFEAYPWLETIDLWFILPRRNEQTHHQYKRSDLDSMKKRIHTIIERAEDPASECNPTTEGCRWCGAKLTCPALKKNALVLVDKYKGQSDDMDMTTLANAHPSEISDPNVLRRMLDVASIMEEWAKSVKYHAKNLVNNEGVEIPDYTMRHRKGKPKTGNADEIFNVLSLQLTPQEFMEACSVSVPKLQKMISAKAPRGEKAFASEQVLVTLANADLYEEGPDQEFLSKNKKKTS